MSSPAFSLLLAVRLGSLADRLARDPAAARDNPDPCSKANLLWLCRTALTEGPHWPADKTGRWTGFVEGVLAEEEHFPVSSWENPLSKESIDSLVLSPVATAHQQLLTRYQTLPGHPLEADLARLACQFDQHLSTQSPDVMGLVLGYLQGRLCRRGWLDVGVERDVSRPLFHAAYKAEDQGVPATFERKLPTLSS
jgi:hypothetical protein